MSANHPGIGIASAQEFPINSIDLEDRDTCDGGARITRDASTVAHEALYTEGEVRPETEFPGIVGQSPAPREVLDLVEMVARSNSTGLLLGETETGKELIAQAIHNRSRGRKQPLVKVNCAAIPTGHLESELFGHERGAFTRAVAQRIGRLELTDQGSLFLDEIGDIPLKLEPKLLRGYPDGCAIELIPTLVGV